MNIIGDSKNAVLMKFLGNSSITEGWGYFDTERNLWLKVKGEWKFNKVGGIPVDLLRYHKIQLYHYNPFTKNTNNDEVQILFFFGLEDRQLFSITDAIPLDIMNEHKSLIAENKSLTNARERLLHIMNIKSNEDAIDDLVAKRNNRAKESMPYSGGNLNNQGGGSNIK